MTENNTSGKQLYNFELLAPAGSFAIFKAVIAAGADAVYVGGNRFGARAYADNFSEEELLEAIDYAHLYGRKVYLTVNTLLKNSETDELYDYLLPFYERGLDAVLVQDFGVLTAIHRMFPELPIHTSTQMTVTSAEAARIFSNMGVTRMVMARELSLEEMKQIYEETGMELEAFVHGALCYCYSGQCLFSSMLGGRSGNRGRCAQPCRLPYAVLDENHKKYRDDCYVLSLKDMCGIGDLNKLAESGVYSLKIEGRMKQISYAAGVVSYYRKYIDAFLENGTDTVSKADRKAIAELGCRNGFTDAYYSRKNGPEMVTFTKPGYEKTNETLQQKVTDTYGAGAPKIPVSGKLILKKRMPAYFQVNGENVTASFEGMTVMEAQKKPLDKRDVEARMKKTGDTPFVMETVEIDMESGIFLPNGALNELRREALANLKTALLSPYFRPAENRVSIPDSYRKMEDFSEKETYYGMEKSSEEKHRRVVCLAGDRRQLSPVLASEVVELVVLDVEAYQGKNHFRDLSEDIMLVQKAGKKCAVALPRIFRKEVQRQMEAMLGEWKQLPISAALVRNYEELAFVKEYFSDWEILTDSNLYCYNDWASASFQEQGVSLNTVPLELNCGEIRHRNNSDSMMVVYGYYPLMVSAQCVHANTKGCDNKPGICYLKDRYQTEFPVKNNCSFCYNVIYNSLPVLLFSALEELKKSGISVFRLDFTVETASETKKVLDLFSDFLYGRTDKYPDYWQNRYTNGHYKRGVE